MRDVRNQQAIFTSLKNAIITTRGASQSIAYDQQRVDRVLKDTTLEVEPFGFPDTGEDKVSVPVLAGSQVDNRDFTTDSVHFSFGGRQYESVEDFSESGISYGLRVSHKGEWRHCEQVFSADDKLR